MLLFYKLKKKKRCDMIHLIHKGGCEEMKQEKRIQYIMIAVALFFLAALILYQTFRTPRLLPKPVVENQEAAITTVSNDKDNIVNEKADSDKKNINQAEVKEKAEPTQAKPISSIVNINSAGLEELMTLKGIGEVKANAIITYRKENGGFSAPEEIKNVKGIGEKTYQNIAPYITIS